MPVLEKTAAANACRGIASLFLFFFFFFTSVKNEMEKNDILFHDMLLYGKGTEIFIRILE